MYFEVCASLGVMGGDNGIVMYAAVNFDYQFAGGAIEVRNERFDRVLKAKAQTADLPILQAVPQYALRWRFVTPQLPRPLHQFRRGMPHSFWCVHKNLTYAKVIQ